METGWPGQAEKLFFNLEQVTALASVVRSEVFFAFGPHEPRSTTDVAREIGKAPAAVRHHVVELARVGLILPVAKRKKRSRMEDLYVHAAVHVYTSPTEGQPAEYVKQMNRGFSAILRAMARERAANVYLRKQLGEQYPFQALFNLEILRLNDEQAADLRTRLLDITREYLGQEDPQGKRYRVVGYMQPTLSETLPRLDSAYEEDGEA